MDFYIIPTNGKEFRFPVNPPSIEVITGTSIETIDLNDIGEYDIPVGEKRAGYRFSSFFPAYYDSYCQYVNIPNPNDAINRLLELRKAQKPVRFLVSDSPINDLVYITNVNYEIRGGEVGDIYFEIEFRSYREIKVRKTTRKIPEIKRPRPNPKPKPRTYTVKSGDTLWSIARRFYGSGTQWRKIWNVKANKDMLIKRDKRNKTNPGHWIYPGQKLVIP